MTEVHRAIFTRSQQLCRLKDVLDLSPIQFHLSQRINLLVREALALGESNPDLSPTLKAEIIIHLAEVDSRVERGINVVYAVGGQKQETFVVFEDSEEDGDQFVPLDIMS